MNIYVWGSSDHVATILQAVASLITSNDFHSLLLLVFIISLALVLVKMLLRFDGEALLKGFGFYMMTIALIFSFMRITTSVNIIDNVSGAARTVDNVPVGLAFLASVFSTGEKVILNLFESFYTIPNNINYSNAGYNYAPLVFNTLSRSKVPDPYLMRSIKRFIYDCFFDDVVYKNKNFEDLVYAIDIYAYMNPVRNGLTTYYSRTNPEGVVINCDQAYQNIGNQLDNYSNSAFLQAFSAFVPVADNNTKVQEVFNTYLSQPGTDLKDAFKQTVFARMTVEALRDAALESGVSGDASAYATKVALLTAFKNWQVSGDVARQLVPYLKIIITMLLFALFPFVLITMMTPMRWRFLHTYAFWFMWIALWEPIMSVLNYVISILLSDTFEAFSRSLSATTGGYNLANMEGIYEQATALLSIGSWFAAAVPFLALALAKGSEYALTSLASSFSGMFSAVGSSVASKTVDPAAAGKTLGEANVVAEFGGGTFASQQAMSTYFSTQKMFGENRGLSFTNAFPGGIQAAAQKSIEHQMMENTFKGSSTGLVSGTKLMAGTQAAMDAFKRWKESGGEGSFDDFMKMQQSQQYVDWLSRVKSDIGVAIKSGLLKGFKDVNDFMNAYAKGDAQAINAYQDFQTKIGELSKQFNTAELLAKSEVFGDFEKFKEYAYANNLLRNESVLGLAKTLAQGEGKDFANLSENERLDYIRRSALMVARADAEKRFAGAKTWEQFKEAFGGDVVKAINAKALLEGRFEGIKSDAIAKAYEKGLITDDLLAKAYKGNYLSKLASGISGLMQVNAFGGVQALGSLLGSKGIVDLKTFKSKMDTIANAIMEANPGMSRSEAWAKAADIMGQSEGSNYAGFYKMLGSLSRRYGEDKALELYQTALAYQKGASTEQVLGKLDKIGGMTPEEKFDAAMAIEKFTGKTGIAREQLRNSIVDELQGLGYSEHEAIDLLTKAEYFGLMHSLGGLALRYGVKAIEFVARKIADAAKGGYRFSRILNTSQTEEAVERLRRQGKVSDAHYRQFRNMVNARDRIAQDLERVEDSINNRLSSLREFFGDDIERMSPQEIRERAQKLFGDKKINENILGEANRFADAVERRNILRNELAERSREILNFTREHIASSGRLSKMEQRALDIAAHADEAVLDGFSRNRAIFNRVLDGVVEGAGRVFRVLGEVVRPIANPIGDILFFPDSTAGPEYDEVRSYRDPKTGELKFETYKNTNKIQ
ncbi:conjugal transfer protein TraG N-terminal domain-containing protein [Persephonella sp. KM09-Lau-8]|uniref:conjugal transfer protein TraG N-terminal domain-containing protein n=1 Tax=Persephonella sp. KM09-Lau-8 TaxID=1158345 RepID=UPI0004973BD6|nr:conjugal transfer protein TraG N-terminal domain-containing protein [Persephonella sp. KM09-Lau-8]